MTVKPWSRTTRILIIIAAIIGLIATVISFSPLVQSLVVAALLAYLLHPIARWLARRTRLNMLWAARLTYGLFLLLLAGIPAGVSTVAFNQFESVEADFLAAITELIDRLAQPIELFDFQFQPQMLLDNLAQSGGNALAAIPGGALDALAGLSTNLLWGLAVLVSLYYFLTDGYQIKCWLVGLVAENYQEELSLLIDEVDEVWRVFLRAQLIIFAIFIALLGGSMFSVVWMYRAGLLPLSPVGLVVLLVAVYVLVQNIDNVVVRPYFFGESLKLHSGVVFIGLIGGIAFGGVLGVIIVVPMIATLKVVGRYIHRRLLGLPPWPETEPPAGELSEIPAIEPESGSL